MEWHADWGVSDLHDCLTQTLSISDKVRTKLFGLKTAAEKEASRQRRLAVEAQWRAEYESKQVCITSECIMDLSTNFEHPCEQSP